MGNQEQAKKAGFKVNSGKIAFSTLSNNLPTKKKKKKK